MPNAKNIEPYKMKKGTTLNPNGRPKGSRNRSSIVKYWLETEKSIKNPITGKEETLPIEDQITIALIGKALKGDVNAFRELMDSGYGKLTDKTELTGKDGKELQSNIIVQYNGTPINLKE
jgi:hypothetical protein